MNVLYVTSEATALNAGNASNNPSWIVTGDVEMEIVFRMYNNGPQQVLLIFGAPGESLATNILYELVYRAGKMGVFHEYSAAGTNFDYTEPNVSMALNRWYRWKVVRSGMQYIGYLNGVERFRTTFPTSPNTSTTGQAQDLKIGVGFGTAEAVLGGSIAYVNIKNSSGVSVYTFGENPPGDDPVAFNTYKATIPPDPFEYAVERPVQYHGGMIDTEPFGYAVPRPAQRVSGYFLEPTATGEGESKINAPRQEPLEISWQDANPDSF
jgi:hypothetical protein